MLRIAIPDAYRVIRIASLHQALATARIFPRRRLVLFGKARSPAAVLPEVPIIVVVAVILSLVHTSTEMNESRVAG